MRQTSPGLSTTHWSSPRFSHTLRVAKLDPSRLAIEYPAIRFDPLTKPNTNARATSPFARGVADGTNLMLKSELTAVPGERSHSTVSGVTYVFSVRTSRFSRTS